MHRTLTRIVVAFAVVQLVGPGAAAAQSQRAPEALRNADGQVFDFSPDGAWRVLARRVAAQRRLMMAQGNWSGLNAAMAAPSTAPAPAAVTGVRKIPAILFAFSDSARAPGFAAGAGDTSKYNQLLFSATAPTGFPYSTPYSIRSFYNQMSNGLLDLQGVVIGWDTLANPEATYTGGSTCTNPYNSSGNCNGIWSGAATTAMQQAFTQAVAKYDGTVNFSQFDNDGPDGVANSGDDDGYVDMAIFIHSELDGACLSPTNNHLWSHRYVMSYTTNDAKAGGGFIRFRDYTLQAGVGGASGCTASQIMSIGTAAHESGHAFGLPDLYDTQQTSEGIGNWGLMGSGNQSSGASPSRMEAWSLNQLGWTTVTPITTSNTYSFGPAPTSDSTFLIRFQGTNTRKEYYLLENRQASQSDTALIRVTCSRSGLIYPVNCHGGLAIWHVDSAKIQQNGGANAFNTGAYHALSLVQADNLGELEKTPGSGDRGDAGDLWPGFGTGTPKTRYAFDTGPAAVTDSTGLFVGFEITNITQTATDGAMSFQVAFGNPTVVRAADTLAQVKVDGTAYNRFASLLSNGSMHTIAMDSAQTTSNGKTQFVWASWSDAGLRSHTITGSFAGDSISATVSTKYKIQATTAGSGSVVSLPVVNHASGDFVAKNSSMTLTATSGTGTVFERWTGDTNVTSNPLALTMGKPYTVVAVFSGALTVTPPGPLAPVMGKPFNTVLTSSGGTSQHKWVKVGGAFPSGISLATDGTVSGTATVSGPFSVDVRDSSGVQTADATISVTVSEPALTVTNTLGVVLGTGGTLTADDKNYLDLLGNKNAAYDVGDFLAWVDKTNAVPASSPLAGVLPPPPPSEEPPPEEDPL